jgi:CRP-like cAMP-binding protein
MACPKAATDFEDGAMRDETAERPQNRLLASLSDEDFDRLHPHLEPVTLEYRRSLYRENRIIDYVYFFEEGVGSLVKNMRNGTAVEVGTIGNEGFVGLPILFGDNRAPSETYVQVPGFGFRIRAEVFWRELEASNTLRTAMLHYAHVFFNLVAQSAACAHLHSLDQRCCRWLLMTRDRMHLDEFQLTQEFLAMMLGVRRAGVTVAAGELQRAGLIRYQRGYITILDRKGLQKRACECYEVSRSEFNRLLGRQRGGPPRARRDTPVNLEAFPV